MRTVREDHLTCPRYLNREECTTGVGTKLIFWTAVIFYPIRGPQEIEELHDENKNISRFFYKRIVNLFWWIVLSQVGLQCTNSRVYIFMAFIASLSGIHWVLIISLAAENLSFSVSQKMDYLSTRHFVLLNRITLERIHYIYDKA